MTIFPVHTPLQDLGFQAQSSVLKSSRNYTRKRLSLQTVLRSPSIRDFRCQIFLQKNCTIMSEPLIAISMPIFIRKLAQVRSVVLSSKSSVSSEPNAIWGITAEVRNVQ